MRRMIAITALLLPLLATAQPTRLRADKAKSYIEYGMRHALHAWKGTSREVNCILETASDGTLQRVAAAVPVKSFDSKSSNRDAHMLEVTDALKHPNITFSSTGVTPVAGGYKVAGKMSFHGIAKEMEITVKESKEGAYRRFSSQFTILLEDFRIERPSLMMVKTDNEVSIRMEFFF